MKPDPLDEYMDLLREEGALNDAMLEEALRTKTLPELLAEAAASYEAQRRAFEAEFGTDAPEPRVIQ